MKTCANFPPRHNGENYSRATLLSLRNGIERFLNTPPNNRGISFNKDSRFVLSNQMLDAKIKQLKKDGLQNTTHKPAIEQEDLEKLKNGEILSLTQPLSLLRNVWFHISLYWCRRGFEGQRRLKKSSFVFGEDANGGLFATMSHDETTKNHPGGVSDVESYEKNGRMYKTNSPTDGYSALELFLSKLNQQAAGLSRVYTNHSVRAAFNFPLELSDSQADNRELQRNFTDIVNKFLKHFKKITVIY